MLVKGGGVGRGRGPDNSKHRTGGLTVPERETSPELGEQLRREQVEEQLRASEERLHSVLRSASIGTFEYDMETGEGHWNDVEFELLGLKPGDAPGHPDTFFRYVHPDDLEAVQAAWQEGLQTGELDVDFRIVRADGQERWLTGKGRFAGNSDTGGRPTRFLGVNFDITERKQAEQRLFDAQQRLTALMNALPVGVSFSDDATSSRITGNPTVLAQFEVGRTDNLSASAPDPEAPGRQVRFFRDGQPIVDAELPLQRAIAENNEILPMELEVRLPSGRTWYAVASGAPIHDEQGRLTGGVAVTMDITARRLAEDRLRRMNEELARSNKELEQFAYISSHDLQEPLRNIVAFTGLLRDRYQGRLDAKADEYLAYTAEGATRMQTLINDLLAYSRVGGQPGELTPTDVREALETALTNLEAPRQAADAVVTIGQLPTLTADGAQLAQVFQNLIGNSIKYRRADVVPEIHVGARRCPGEWLFFVRDNGIGIDPGYFKKIFEIFQRLHARQEYPGTGVGLAICRKIVERHGGRIWVESQPGEGATFSFTIADTPPWPPEALRP
jgi:PAS domain S-box-containing protein